MRTVGAVVASRVTARSSRDQRSCLIAPGPWPRPAGWRGPAPSPGSPPIAGTGTSYNPSWTPSSCVRDGSGGCISMNAAIAAGFQSGSGISMAKLRSINQMLLVVVTLLVVGSAMLGVWQRYARGVIATADLLLYMKRGLIVVCMVFVVMSLF